MGWMVVALIVLGIVGVILGSDQAIRGAETVARARRVPPVVIGLTLTSIGTSLPEIATNVAAGLSSRAGVDASGLLVGNIVGSCFSQVTLLLGLTGLLAASLKEPPGFLRDGAMLMIAAALMLAVCLDGVATPGEALALLAVYGAYLTLVLRAGLAEATSAPAPSAEGELEAPSLGWEVVRTLVGLVVVLLCAELVVGQAADLARQLGLDESLIGLGLGIGTGLPELAVAVQSVRRGSADIGVGNLIGSNITDPLLSFSAGALLHPVTVSPVVLRFDFPVWLVSSAVALVFVWTHDHLSRRESVLLLAIFVGFFVGRYLLYGL